MRIATINLGHRTRRPSVISAGLFEGLQALNTDVLFLTECVSTPALDEALGRLWPHMLMSPQLQYDSRGRWSNQVVALSTGPMKPQGGHVPVPTQCAATNFLAIETGGLSVIGVRAPAYRRAADWYAYWTCLNQRLDGDVVIGDLNVDPSRASKRDRVLPGGWSVVTPTGCSYRSTVNGTESSIDHALVAGRVQVITSKYCTEFFGRWGLDHCPLVVDIEPLLSTLS
jgi:hypothetical protein